MSFPIGSVPASDAVKSTSANASQARDRPWRPSLRWRRIPRIESATLAALRRNICASQPPRMSPRRSTSSRSTATVRVKRAPARRPTVSIAAGQPPRISVVAVTTTIPASATPSREGRVGRIVASAPWRSGRASGE